MPGRFIESEVRTPSRAGLRAGRYELLSRLAAGGMGEVFIARQQAQGAFEKRVALKLLLPHLSNEEEFVHMFLDEARIAARMNHPNIVQIFDLGVAEGRYFIAMSLVEGASLSRLLAACRPQTQKPSLPLVRSIAAGLCAGLTYAHELKGPAGEDLAIVHRDVNPSNILISTAGAVTLTDFGIAKAQDNLHRTRPGDVKGKYAYMAPEQMKEGRTLDARADIFGVGATLFEALTLLSPFARASDPETIDAVRQVEPQPLETLRPDVTQGMRRALVGALKKDPTLRTPSARLFKDLFIDGPVATPDELGQWVERMCPKEVGAFRGLPMSPIQEVGTRSLVEPLPEKKKEDAPSPPVPGQAAAPAGERPVTRTRSPRHRSRRAAMGYGFLAGVLIVFAVVGLRLLIVPGHAPAPLPPLPAPPPAAAVEVPEPEVVDEPGPAAPPEARPARRRTATKKARAAVSEPARDEPMRVGYLSADANPWAALYIEGQEVERTPLSRYPLTAGEHVLVFKNPELGKEIKRTVKIEEGKVATLRVDFTQ